MKRHRRSKRREIDLIRAYHGQNMNAEMAKVGKLLHAESARAFESYMRLSNIATQISVLARK